MMANWWQGHFPWQNTLADGYERTSPVGAFQPNGFGLYDLCGNVWEWTKDLFEDPRPSQQCCGPNHALDDPHAIERRAIRGGSHLCAPTYCLRFRPAARQSETVDTSTSHHRFSLRHPDMRSSVGHLRDGGDAWASSIRQCPGGR